jgi:hypothetical protein
MHIFLTRRRATLSRALVLGAILLGLVSCSQDEVAPWTDKEMKELLGYFEEIGQAYALVDICMPMIEEDEEAKYQLIADIKADRYARILQMDTERELKKLLAHFRGRGGTSKQNLSLRLRYEESRREAEMQISSVQVCVDTLKDYANTIINMRVR